MLGQDSLHGSERDWTCACAAPRGNEHGRAFRDLEWEAKVHEISQKMGIGAQFGGKYFCHDVRVVRLPRHGASCPVGIGVSCSADRQAKAKITKVQTHTHRHVYDLNITCRHP